MGIQETEPAVSANPVAGQLISQSGPPGAPAPPDPAEIVVHLPAQCRVAGVGIDEALDRGGRTAGPGTGTRETTSMGMSISEWELPVTALIALTVYHPKRRCRAA